MAGNARWRNSNRNISASSGRSLGELINAHIELIPASEPEQAALKNALAHLAGGMTDVSALPHFLVAAMYVPLYRCAESVRLMDLPAWFWEPFIRLAMHSPQVFLQDGDAEAYAKFTERWVGDLRQLTDNKWTETAVQRMGLAFTQGANFAAINTGGPGGCEPVPKQSPHHRANTSVSELRLGVLPRHPIRAGDQGEARIPGFPVC